ncbi:hypothetical protein F5X96DRAFT_672381 [Biscogniauxia mediterranea]|nr:hypothetical protein F5X96DRAFT_672381 [Biscogniauxia mediterranea]
MARSVSPESAAAGWGSDLDNRNLTDGTWHPANGHTGLMPDSAALQQPPPVDLEFQHFHLSSAPTPYPPHTEDQLGDQYQSSPLSYSTSTYSYTYINDSYTSDVQYAAASSSNPEEEDDNINAYASGAADHPTDGPSRTNGVNGKKRRRARSEEDESEPRTMPTMRGTHVHDPQEHEDLAYGQATFDSAYSYSPSPDNERSAGGSERHSQRRRRVRRAIAQVDEELGNRRRSSSS